MTEKEYGLILPGKKKAMKLKGIRNLNPLRNSDDELERSDSESAMDWVEASLKRSAGNAGQKAAQRNQIKKALEEDSSIFQYDEVYDDIKSKHNEKQKEKTDKKPKYMDSLLKHASRRKLESERRMERKVQRERDAEGDEFKDKEAFITTSFLKKQEELKKAEEEELREKKAEEMCDVQKHKNYSVFYGNLLNQKLGKDSVESKYVKEKNYRKRQKSSSSGSEEDGSRNRKDVFKSSDILRKDKYHSENRSKHESSHKNRSDNENVIRIHHSKSKHQDRKSEESGSSPERESSLKYHKALDKSPVKSDENILEKHINKRKNDDYYRRNSSSPENIAERNNKVSNSKHSILFSKKKQTKRKQFRSPVRETSFSPSNTLIKSEPEDGNEVHLTKNKKKGNIYPTSQGYIKKEPPSVKDDCTLRKDSTKGHDSDYTDISPEDHKPEKSTKNCLPECDSKSRSNRSRSTENEKIKKETKDELFKLDTKVENGKKITDTFDPSKCKNVSKEASEEERLEKIRKIYVKRNIGDQFNEAVKRYFNRLAETKN